MSDDLSFSATGWSNDHGGYLVRRMWGRNRMLVAIFVGESDAEDYANWRNELLAETGHSGNRLEQARG